MHSFTFSNRFRLFYFNQQNRGVEGMPSVRKKEKKFKKMFLSSFHKTDSPQMSDSKTVE